MQKTLHNLADVSLYFMIVLGLLHIAVSLLVAQGVVDHTSLILFRSLDLPFLAIALIYGSTRLSLLLEGIFGQVKVPLIICSICSAVLFLIALVLNFGFPDVSLF